VNVQKTTEDKNDTCKKRKLDATDFYTELWKGRDYELNFLWQRSVFLGAFMLAFITIFCGGVLRLFNFANIEKYNSQNSLIINIQSIMNLQIFSLLCFLLMIAIIGLMFSLLWIFMVKGSKYWYECYEESIKLIFDNSNNWGEQVFEHSFFEKYISQKKEEPQFPNYNNLYTKDNNKNIFSTSGGKFSVSRVNVLIGQILGLFWIVSIVIITFLMLCFTTKIIFYIPFIFIIIICLVLFFCNFYKTKKK
jgi:hypothetical protein